jgi:hypothetical protein
MCGKASARFDRSGQNVMPFADIWRGVLQGTGDQADLVRRLHGEEGRSRPSEVVKTHGFTEPFHGSRADDIVDAART